MGPLDHTDEEIREMEDEEQCQLRESWLGAIEYVDGDPIYEAVIDHGYGPCRYEVTAEEHRIIDQYEAARRRQAEAEALAERRWKKPPPPPLPRRREPSPEAIPPGGKLTARQGLFCEHYTAHPVATRAAVLAGYGEKKAANQGWRLLKNPVVLARIAALRAERKVRYAIEADTLQDKLEAIFFEALAERNHAAAVSALRLQAGLAGLPLRRAAAPAAERKRVPPRRAKRGVRGGKSRRKEERRG